MYKSNHSFLNKKCWQLSQVTSPCNIGHLFYLSSLNVPGLRLLLGLVPHCRCEHHQSGLRRKYLLQGFLMRQCINRRLNLRQLQNHYLLPGPVHLLSKEDGNDRVKETIWDQMSWNRAPIVVLLTMWRAGAPIMKLNGKSRVNEL